MKRKLLAAALALLLLAGLCPTVSAEEEEENTVIRIGSAEDFLAFANNCTLDSWSLGVQVELLTDISLEGMEFAPVPTFGGSFDGGGHTISGLSITQSVSPAGLFGTLQPTAVVKNLKVSGLVAPDGDGRNVGGIVGENYGTLANCGFTGEVTGKTNVGGIAGANYGALRLCTASGSVTGSSRTGGIVGYHDGGMSSCRSEMAVNTESVDPTIDPSDIHLNFNLDFSKTSNLDVSDAASDTGGIAGYSSGSITECVNVGDVGYPHIGYNLGGIAGRSCGLVVKCENKGNITGRKDVGGIVGQIEPHIQTILSPDYLETLSQQFENLGGLVSRTGSHGAEMGGDVQDSIAAINGYQSSARSAVEAMASGAVSGEVDKGALSDLSTAIHGMVSASGSLKSAIGEGVDSLSSDISAISGQISAISRTFALATEDAKQETVTDISDVDLDAITEGKVLSCTNRGVIEADLNVGGITGIMGLESTADPEDDTSGGSLTQRRRYELKDIVQDCENLGTVTGKRSYVGGICGRMELGLISGCRSYGTVSSENGDYVGGIAGLTGGTIRSCFAKCTLSGGSYIGGIVGSGIDEDYSGDSSTVTDCYSMVEISEYEAYIGAIAGVNTGVFTQNYFVSDTLAGINRVSYASLAEPVSYDALHGQEDLPDPLKTFTLSFLADGEIVKTLSFHYGDSFDNTVFPEIPQKEGCYAQWSREELQDLRFDTVVEANYYPYITSLQSDTERSEGKPVLFVQGQFKAGDVLWTEPGETAFPETQVLEQWHLYIPADGLQTHSIRYLPSQEGVTLYLLKNGVWEWADTEEMGSYLRFDAEGAEVEFAAVAQASSRNRWVLPAAALAGLAVLVGLILLGKKLKKRWWILAVMLLLCAAAGYFLQPRTQVGQGIEAYSLVRAGMEQDPARMRLTVKAQIEDTDAGFTAEIHRTTVGGVPVSVISEAERKLYYADGAVFLENGTAYRLNTAAPDYWELMETVLELCRQTQIEVQEGGCTVTVEAEQAVKLLKLLMPSAANQLPQDSRLTVELKEESGQLAQVRFVGAGNLEDSVKTPYSLTAVVEMLPAEEVQIPKAVAQELSSGDYQAKEVYSDDLVELMEAWMALRGTEPVCADMVLEASCGELTLSDAFLFYQWKVSGDRVRAVEKDGKVCYFTDSGACDETGRKITAQATQSLDAGRLLDIALDNLENTTFRCRQEDGIREYTFTLNQTGMEQMVCVLFPGLENMDVSFDRGTIQLTVGGGEIQSAAVACTGSGTLLTARKEIRLQLDIRLLSDSPGPELPDAVREALLK